MIHLVDPNAKNSLAIIALIDTGANINLITQETMKSCPWLSCTTLQSPLKILLANNDSVFVTKIATAVSISAKGITSTNISSHSLFVINAPLRYPVILGGPWQAKSGVIINPRELSIDFQEPQDSITIQRDDSLADHLQEELLASGLWAEISAAPILETWNFDELPLQLHEAISEYSKAVEPFQGKLPLSRGDLDHTVSLINPLTAPIMRPTIPLNSTERTALAQTLNEMLACGTLKQSTSQWGAPCFFVKQNSKLRLVIDFRALNSVIRTFPYPLPRTSELIDRLGKHRYFTKLDLKSGFHQLRVRDADTYFLAIRTPQGSFEYLVSPFGEKNSPSFFSRLIEHVVTRGHEDSNENFVDDIIVSSVGLDEHWDLVKSTLKRLAKERLSLRISKCVFAAQKIEFLGFSIDATTSTTTVTATANKLSEIQSWPQPQTQRQLQSFLGLANFYRKLIKDFAAIATPLLNMVDHKTSLSQKLSFARTQSDAFENLKSALASPALLIIADPSKQFVLHTDASDYALGAVLSQQIGGDLRPVGFFSKKLNERELRWSTYDKEFFALVQALLHFRVHLQGAEHKIRCLSDHHSLQHLLTQPRLSAKQSRWLDLVSSFDFESRYVPGKYNEVADALSRRPDFDIGAKERDIIRTETAKRYFFAGLKDEHGEEIVSMLKASDHHWFEISATTEARFGSDLLNSIQEEYKSDKFCSKVMLDPTAHGYELRFELLYRISSDTLLVPRVLKITNQIITEAHSILTAGHPGVARTIRRLRPIFFWPLMSIDIINFVQQCSACQQSKHRHSKLPGKLQPIEALYKGDVLTADFIGPLSKCDGFDSVMVVTDKWSRRVWYLPTKITATAEEIAQLFFDNVVRHQGLPRVLVTDRDVKFTSRFWRALWKQLGTGLAFSSSYHPQTNGATEKANSTFLSALRTTLTDHKERWTRIVIALEIAFNSTPHSATGFSPFELDIGMEIELPLSHLNENNSSEQTTYSDFLSNLHRTAILAHEAMTNTAEKMKLAADKHRAEAPHYKTGDRVWLKSKMLRVDKKAKHKLEPIYSGPFTVVDTLGRNTVILDLPPHSKCHRTINVENVKPFFSPPPEELNRDQQTVEEHPVPQAQEEHSNYNIPSQGRATRATAARAWDLGETHELVDQPMKYDIERSRSQRRSLLRSP